MAPIWPSYYGGARRIMYVVDMANLTQLGEATLLLLQLLAHPNMRAQQVSVDSCFSVRVGGVCFQKGEPLPDDSSALLF